MTMTAQYFLSVAGGDIRRDRPDFARNAATLSALWLIGFFPFLSTALGGFLLYAALPSIAGWAIVWALRLRISGCGNGCWCSGRSSSFRWPPASSRRVTGASLAWCLTRPGTLYWRTARSGGRFRWRRSMPAHSGWYSTSRASRSPQAPKTFTRLKVYAIIVAVAVLDAVVMENHSPAPSWLAWPLLALPSAAYYGVLLAGRAAAEMRAPHGLRPLYAVSLFLMLLACFAAGAPGPLFLWVRPLSVSSCRWGGRWVCFGAPKNRSR